MRNIKDEVDASWFAPDPDAEHNIFHGKFRAQASWMMVDVPRLSSINKDILTDGERLETVKTIGHAKNDCRIKAN